MKKILLSLFFIMVIIIPSNVKADTLLCNNEEYSKISKLASNIKISYRYEVSNNEAKYTVTLTNLYKGMILLDDSNGNRIVVQNNNSELNFSYKVGGVKKYYIYSTACGGGITSKSITLPEYNKNAIDKRCEGLEEYQVCNRWSGYNADPDKFEEDLKKAKKDYELRNPNKKDEPKKELSLLQKIIKFVVKYLFVIIGILLVIIVIANVLYENYKKKHEFDFKL